MIDWYAPLTFLPAIGLLIMSTSSFIVSLNDEIYRLEEPEDCDFAIIQLKLKQLKKLGLANVFLYISALLFMLAGLSMAFTMRTTLFHVILISGCLTTCMALVLLIIHAMKSVKIREQHLRVS